MKKFNLRLAAVAMVALLGAGSAFAVEKPGTVIHVVTVKWKDGTTPEQIQKAITGAEELANSYKGIKRLWVKPLKVQGKGYTHAIVMEFENEKALKDYAGTDAQKKWYEVYLPIRDQSTTHDITN